MLSSYQHRGETPLLEMLMRQTRYITWRKAAYQAPAHITHKLTLQ
ncbi:hypothetical protein HMPREF9019_0611 [Hoylesella timonensis CRIS 5C-B1]|uniref:Uncharacterized protein n=1 Tax=Hoylesella timonensis CRIS 5C-B1 TaxID=679189 RepID=D1VX47_9BACT|nr:hypothetical protein HMPREF9019_0611 [Hoylesella timonensis CRIS 5C-B1]